MRRDLAKEYKNELDKIRKAFKKLRSFNIYAQARPLGRDNSICQNVIQHFMEADPDIRGGVYWSTACEHLLEELPVLHLGYLPKTYPTRDEMLREALRVAKEINQILEEAGLRTIWNQCICNTISVVLVSNPEPDQELEKVLGELANRPCRCEEVWELQFRNYAEQRLGNLKGKGHQSQPEDSDWQSESE